MSREGQATPVVLGTFEDSSLERRREKTERKEQKEVCMHAWFERLAILAGEKCFGGKNPLNVIPVEWMGFGVCVCV